MFSQLSQLDSESFSASNSLLGTAGLAETKLDSKQVEAGFYIATILLLQHSKI